MGEYRVPLVVSCVTVTDTNDFFAVDSVRLRVFMAALSSRFERRVRMLMTNFTSLHAVLCFAVLFLSRAYVHVSVALRQANALQIA